MTPIARMATCLFLLLLASFSAFFLTAKLPSLATIQPHLAFLLVWYLEWRQIQVTESGVTFSPSLGVLTSDLQDVVISERSMFHIWKPIP